MNTDPNSFNTSIRLVIDMPYIYKDISVPTGMTRQEAVNSYLESHAQEIAQDYLQEIENEGWFLREIEFGDGQTDVADIDCFDPYAGEYMYYC